MNYKGPWKLVLLVVILIIIQISCSVYGNSLEERPLQNNNEDALSDGGKKKVTLN